LLDKDRSSEAIARAVAIVFVRAPTWIDWSRIISWNGVSSRNDWPRFRLRFLLGAPRRKKASATDR